jgi:putative ABC transport system permease protein
VRLLVKSQLRFLRHAPWSAATALVGVALGVASVVAVHLIGAEVERALEAAAPPHLSGLTHLLQRPDLATDDYFELRDRWRMQRDSAVTALVPVIEGQLLFDERSVQLLGADWLAMPPPPSGRRSGVAVPVEVLVGESVLVDTALDLAVGETASLGGRTFEIADVLETGLGPSVFADIATAQWLLQRPASTLSLVGLAVDDPWARWRRWLNRLMPGFAAGLPVPDAAAVEALLEDGDGAREWRVTPITAERPSASFARAVLFNLGALGTLALLVAWFLIYQVGVIWLRRQQLLLTRLHVIGVSEGQLRFSFMILFAALGTFATVVGLALGLALAEVLVALAAPGVGVTDETTPRVASIDGWLLAKAVVSGLGVCLVGGFAAFSRGYRERAWSPWWRRLAAPLLVAAMIVGIAVEATGVLGGFLAIFAMSLLGAMLVVPALAALRRAVTVLPLGLLWRLALREVAWYPRVLSVALAALTLAVATGIGIGLMVESFRADFTRMLDSRLAGDLYVYEAEREFDALDGWLRGQPEVASISQFGSARVRLRGVPAELGYSRFDVEQSARYGHAGVLQPGEALLSERLARDLGVATGAAVEIGPGAVVQVAGVFPGFGEATGRLLVDQSTLERLDMAPRFDRLTVDLQPGGAGLAQRLTAAFPGVEVESRAAIRDQALRIFDRTFAITQALTVLALVVAIVGMYNALTALRLNQAPTTRLLHAQGMSRGEQRRISLIRSAVVGGIAALLALPLGVAMAWTLCVVLNPRSFGWSVDLHLPVEGWLLPLVLGVGAALLAGAMPAPRERGALEDVA